MLWRWTGCNSRAAVRGLLIPCASRSQLDNFGTQLSGCTTRVPVVAAHRWPMRPCVRCYAAIGNAEDPCSECGAPQSLLSPAQAQLIADDPPADQDAPSLDLQMLWLAILGMLSACAILGLSFLLFGPSGIAGAMIFFLFCGILWNVVASGGL